MALVHVTAGVTEEKGGLRAHKEYSGDESRQAGQPGSLWGGQKDGMDGSGNTSRVSV